MSRRMQSVIGTAVVLLGLALMVGGVTTHRNGAVVVGIVVAGVAAQRVLSLRKDGGGRRA